MVGTDHSWGCNIIRGIADYADKHGHWNLIIDPRDAAQRSALPARWSGDGIISSVNSRFEVDLIREQSVPIVNVNHAFEHLPGFCSVVSDELERARLAVNHLADRGFTRFGYFAPPARRHTPMRGREFAAEVERHGWTCEVYRPGYRPDRRISWDEQQRRVIRWLESLPKPIGIMAVDSACGRQLTEICSLTEIRVPDDVAVLAGETDELMCDVSSPPLSSIADATRRIGYESAALLAALINGESPPTVPAHIPPLGVIARQSTDILSIDDDNVVNALRFIRGNASRGITVRDILREIPLSRRSLEILFRQYLRRSPAEEIRRVRLERSKELLAQSDLSIAEIAVASGFANATRLGVAFRKEFDVTPLAFRRQLRRG